MSKTITIKSIRPYVRSEHKIDVVTFAQDVSHLNSLQAHNADVYVRTGLLEPTMLANTSVPYLITPRGEDLLASIDSLSDDPEPEVSTKPCSKCNGTGEQPLFVSMETCDRCEGGKIEPAVKPTSYEIKINSGRVSSNRPNTDTILRAAWIAHPKKLPNGEWGARVESLTCKPGDQIQVITLTGKTWLSTIIKLVGVIGYETLVECIARPDDFL